MSFSIIHICHDCSAKNRIPAAHLASVGRCGSCKAPIDPVSGPINVESEKDFDEIITSVSVPVLVDFWAEWCGPCRMAAPEVEAVAKELSGRAVVLKVDTDALQSLGMRYRIQSIPNFAVFRGGRLAFQQAGLAPRAQMRRWITLEP
jgi:thioredoxin 2